MKKLLLSLVAATPILSACTQQSTNVPSAIPQDKDMEQKIESILKKMSLEEKVGQMTQLTIDVVGKGNNVFHTLIPMEFDEALLDTVISKYKV